MALAMTNAARGCENRHRGIIAAADVLRQRRAIWDRRNSGLAVDGTQSSMGAGCCCPWTRFRGPRTDSACSLCGAVAPCCGLFLCLSWIRRAVAHSARHDVHEVGLLFELVAERGKQRQKNESKGAEHQRVKPRCNGHAYYDERCEQECVLWQLHEQRATLERVVDRCA